MLTARASKWRGNEATVETVRMVLSFLWHDCRNSPHKTFVGAFYRAFPTSFRITQFLRSRGRGECDEDVRQFLRGEFNGEEDILSYECPFGHYDCMTKVQPAQVGQAVMALLSREHQSHLSRSPS